MSPTPTGPPGSPTGPFVAQRAASTIAWVISGATFVGGLLQVWDVSSSRLTPILSLVLSGVVIVAGGSLELIARRKGIRWRYQHGGTGTIRGLGPATRASLVGAVLILWLPHGVAQFQDKPLPDPTYGGQSLRYWTNQLHNGRDPIRRRALKVFRKLGATAAGAVPDILRDLKTATGLERCHLVEALGYIGRPAAQAIPALLEEAKSSDACIRRETMQALGTVGVSDPNKVLPTLLRGLDDREGTVRWGAANGLGELGEPAASAIPNLLARIADPIAEHAASLALSKMGPASAPYLLRGMASADEKIRTASARALVLLGPKAAGALPEIVALLQSGDEQKRVDATDILRAIGPPAAQATPRLLDLLTRSTPRERIALVRALGGFGPKAESAVPQLRQVMSNAGDMLRILAAGAIARIKKGDPAAIAELERHLNGGNVELRARSAAELAFAGDSHFEISVAALASAVGDSGADEFTRARAALALGDIGPRAKGAIAALTIATQSPSGIVTANARGALHEIAPDLELPEELHESSGDNDDLEDVSRSPEELMKRLDSVDPGDRRSAVERLGSLGQNPALVVPALMQALNDSEPDVRADAASALGKFRGDAAAAVPALLKFFEEEPDKGSKAIAALSIVLIDPKVAAELRAPLLDLAVDTDSQTAFMAGGVLRMMDLSGVAPKQASDCGEFEPNQRLDPTCRGCIERACCRQSLECDKGTDCSNFVACAEGCGKGEACANRCNQLHPNGLKPLTAWIECYQGPCARLCALDSPNVAGR